MMFQFFCAISIFVFVNQGMLLGQSAEDPAIEDFAKKIVQSMNAGDGSFFQEHFDSRAFDQRIQQHMKMSLEYIPGENVELDEAMEEFTKTITEQLQSMQLGQRLIENFAAGDGKLSYLRSVRDENKTRAILRIVQGNGLNYLELFLSQGKQGDYQIIDCFIHASGQPMSKIIGNSFINVFHSTTGLVNKLLGKGESVTQAMTRIQEIRAAQLAGDYGKANTLVDSIKKPAKDMELVMLVSLAVKSQVGSKEFLDAISYYEKKFPTHPSLNLFRIQAESERGNYEKAFEAVDILERSVGGDPYTHTLRGQLWFTQGNIQKAVKAYEAALVVPETREDVYWALVEISLTTKEFTKTVQLLKTLEKEGDYEFALAELAVLEPYVEFGKSEPFAAWLKERPTEAVEK